MFIVIRPLRRERTEPKNIKIVMIINSRMMSISTVCMARDMNLIDVDRI